MDLQESDKATTFFDDDGIPENWSFLMEDIATNGLCEMLVEIAQSHCDLSVRKSAKEITDWLGDESKCLSDVCAARVAAALESIPSSDAPPASTTWGTVAG